MSLEHILIFNFGALFFTSILEFIIVQLYVFIVSLQMFGELREKLNYYGL